jgi:hypothetical protein
MEIFSYIESVWPLSGAPPFFVVGGIACSKEAGALPAGA